MEKPWLPFKGEFELVKDSALQLEVTDGVHCWYIMGREQRNVDSWQAAKSTDFCTNPSLVCFLRYGNFFCDYRLVGQDWTITYFARALHPASLLTTQPLGYSELVKLLMAKPFQLFGVCWMQRMRVELKHLLLSISSITKIQPHTIFQNITVGLLVVWNQMFHNSYWPNNVFIHLWYFLLPIFNICTSSSSAGEATQHTTLAAVNSTQCFVKFLYNQDLPSVESFKQSEM